MRILFVTNMFPSSERPGYGAFVWQQADQLRRLGHTIDVIDIPGFRSRLHYLKAAVRVRRQTTRVTYDVVHAHYGQSAWAAWFRSNAPLVITFHGSDVLQPGLFQRYSSRMIARTADAVIVVSEQMRKQIRGFVIPCGVDLDVFKPYDRLEARARLGWSTDAWVILFPFDPTRRVKRFDLAKAAVSRLTDEGMKVIIVTVSRVDHRQMPWYYSAADAMLLCSDSEGSSTSIKEALACNLPVVATNVGDTQEILDGIPGTRICTQDVGDIARRLREVLERPAGFAGRTAMARYHGRRTAEKIVDVYHQVVPSSLRY